MKKTLSIGQILADKLALGMGSWRFLIIQSLILATWVVYNIFSPTKFDEYPFVFLNLVLSFQAAYAAPIIMMSSNRKESIDRNRNIKIYNLEKEDHTQLAHLVLHIDNHFHRLNKKIEVLESQIAEGQIKDL